MKNRYLAGAAAALLLSCCRSGEGPESLRLRLKAQRQPVFLWCWATLTAMVVEYMRGPHLESCAVVSRDLSLKGRQGNCCLPDSACWYAAQAGGVEQILSKAYGIQTATLQRALSFPETAESLRKGRVMIAWLGVTESSKHGVLIGGIHTAGEVSALWIIDPMEGVWREVPYQTLLHGARGDWGETIIVAEPNRCLRPCATAVWNGVAARRGC